MEQLTDQELVVLTTIANASNQEIVDFLNTLGKGQFYIDTLQLWHTLQDECINRGIDFNHGTKTVNTTTKLFEGA